MNETNKSTGFILWSIWCFQIFGLVHAIRIFFNKDSFLSNHWDLEKKIAIFLCAGIFLLCGLIRAHMYSNKSLIYNFLHHGTKENPLQTTAQSIKFFFIILAIILGAVHFFVDSANIAETARDVFSSFRTFLRSIIVLDF